MFSFLFDKYQGVGLPNYLANLCLTLEDTTILFYNLHSHQQSVSVPVALHPHQNLVLLVFLTSAILVGMQWYLTAALTCISLTTSDGENIFMYLLVIYESSFRTCLFKSFVQILIGLSVILLCFKSSLYVLNASPLSYLWFTNIFSQFITCLFFLRCSSKDTKGFEL